MSGHSKWSTIKRDKGANDAKRATIFTKLARAISVAAKKGSDPDMNHTLRLAIDKARAQNMPKDNIDRAISKGASNDGDMSEEVIFEGYGPYGVAIKVFTLTDNRNRTVGEVRHAFSRFGGNLGTTGSVSYIFGADGEPTFSVELSEAEQSKVISLLEALDDLDDVSEVVSNLA